MQFRLRRVPSLRTEQRKESLTTRSLASLGSHQSAELREGISSASSGSRALRECPSPRFEMKSDVRLKLFTAGTSLVTNDNDTLGDGDQSAITDHEAQEVHQELFRTGE